MTPVERPEEAGAAPERPAPPAPNDEPGPPALARPAASRGAGAVEWLLRRRAIKRAVAGAKLTGPQAELLRRARLPLELAGRALDPVEPLAAGDGAPAALSLCREAAYWLLRALAPEGAPAPRTLSEAFDLAPAAAVREAAGGDDRLAALRETLAAETFVESAEHSAGPQREAASAAIVFVEALFDKLEGGSAAAVERLRWQRALRVAGAFALAVLVAVGAVFGVRALRQAPDIAAGAAWRTSSAYAGYADSGRLGAPERDIFFHTKEEKDPWIEVDLGSPRTVGSVLVKNRSDYGHDRAVPLVVELSNDGKAWAEVARQPSSFRSWTATFSPRPARYVRLRSPRMTFLHLRRVAVYER